MAENNDQQSSEDPVDIKDLTINDDNKVDTSAPAPVDPAETEAAKNLWNQLEAARAALDALPEDDPQRPEKLLAVASTMGDYHNEAEIKGEGQLLLALDIAAEAEGLAPKDDFWRGSSLFTSMALCLSLYWSTKVMDWLPKAIEFGKEALKFLEEHENSMTPVYYRMIYAGRAEKLSRVYQSMYDEAEDGGDIRTLQEASHWRARAVDYTIPEDHIEGGDLKRWERFRDFCNIQIRIFDVVTDGDWDRLVDLALSQPCDITDSERPTSQYNWWNVFYLMARRWSVTRNPDHLQSLLDHVKELWNLEIKPTETYTCDAEDNQHLLRIAAVNFDRDHSEGTLWEKHLNSIQTAIALWEEVRSHIGCETVDDVEEVMQPVVWLTDLYARRYWKTLKAADGWAYDDINLENCNMSVTLSMFSNQSETSSPSRRLSILNKNVHSSTVGESIVTKLKFTISHKGPGFGSRRLMFVTGKDFDEKPSLDNWVRDRTDEGTYVLGGAIRGRDDDVFEYLENYYKPISTETEDSSKDESKEPTDGVNAS